MNIKSECNPRAVLAVNEPKLIIDKEEKLYKDKYQVSQTVVNLVGLHCSLNRPCSSNPSGSINTKNRSTISARGYVAPCNANVAFKSSSDGEQTLGEKVPSVGFIDDPLNQRVQKGTHLESSGGAR